MVHCATCGKLSMSQTTFGVGGLCCRKCGTKCSTESLGQDAAGLTSVTSSVRNYAANASEEEKSKKYGQQKWGLFETNYQRNKGITTEESLQVEPRGRGADRGFERHEISSRIVVSVTGLSSEEIMSGRK